MKAKNDMSKIMKYVYLCYTFRPSVLNMDSKLDSLKVMK